MLRAAFLAIPTLAAAAPAKVTFDDHVLPVFEQSCLNCHNPDKAKGGLDLSTYEGAMKGGSGGKIAEPGDPSSKLLAVVLRTAEPVMPPEGDPIPREQTEILRAWIEGGLLQNATSSARKPSRPKFDASLRAVPGERPAGPPPMPRDVNLEPARLAERPSAVRSMVLSPRAPLLAVSAPFQVLLYDTRDFELAGVLPFPEGDPVSLAITSDGRHLVVGGGKPGKSGLTATFDLVSGERLMSAGREFDSILCADLRPDLGAVATGSPSRLVKLWNPADGSQTASIKKHTDWVTALDYSPDGILLATGDRNGGVWVWEALTGAEFHTLRAHQAGITAVSFRSDSNLLATGSADGTIRFWEMNGGQETRKLDAHPGGVLAFAWGVDGSFATAGRDHSVKLWKPDFTALRTIDKLPDLPTAVALDSRHVFIADYQGVIHIHRLSDGQPAGRIDNNPPSIASRRHQLAAALVAKPDDPELRQQERRWYRASLQLGAARLRDEAADTAGEAEEKNAEFLETARAIEGIGSKIAAKRSERASFTRIPLPDHPAVREERDSVLALLDVQIEDLVRELEHAAERIAGQRARLDDLLPRGDALAREAGRIDAIRHACAGTGG